jgi:hypothetical protein
LLQTVPGIGELLSLVRLYDIHDIDRFSRVQDLIAYGRLVKIAEELAGKRLDASGKNSGNAHLSWALSAAAAMFLRKNPAGQKRPTPHWTPTGSASIERARSLALDYCDMWAGGVRTGCMSAFEAICHPFNQVGGYAPILR